MSEPEGIQAGEVARLVRVSYRQLDNWIGRGYLRIRDASPGTGHRRRFSPEEVERARMLAALVHAGFTSSAAADAISQGFVTLPIFTARSSP